MLTIFMIGWNQAVGAVITTDVTWTTGNEITDGETVTVNNAATVIVDADMTSGSKVLDTLILGKTTTVPPTSGTGAMEITDQGKLRVERLEIGGENDGFLTIAENSFFFVENSVVFNSGTITNHSTQNWSTKTITWNGSVTFQGNGTINLGSKASGEMLEIADGTLTTSGNLDASNYTLTGGTLQVAGELTLGQTLTNGGTAIELLTSGAWTIDQTQTDGEIIVSGGTLTADSDLDYSSATGSFSMSSGTINLDDHDLNLGDADNFNVTGGSFTAKTLGGSTIRWDAGTLQGSVDTFFSTYYVDNVNAELSNTAVLEVYNNGSGAYTVLNNCSLTDTATVIGPNNLLYIQAAASITTTGGINTADIQFMGRDGESIFIDSGATFEGTIELYNGVSNEIRNGTFNGEVTITNPGDSSTGRESVPVGTGLTEISGGTFNDNVVLNLYRIPQENEDDEDTQNKVTISGGTFNGTLQYTGAGNAIITGGTFDSIETLAAATGTLTIDSDINVTGTDGVSLSGGVLNINSTRTLTVANGLVMEGTTGGTLTGAGTLIANLEMNAGVLAGNLTIDGNFTQSGGQIRPGNSIGQINVSGDFELHDIEIELGENGQSDLVVVGGSITTTDDGTMTVKRLEDTSIQYQDGAEFTALESTTGTITIDPDYQIVSQIGGYNATGSIITQGTGEAYVITLSRSIHIFPAGAKNANHLANYLYELIDDGDPQDQLMLAIASDPNQQLAAEKLSGESHATSLQAIMNAGILRQHVLNQHVRPNRNLQFSSNEIVEDPNTTVRGQMYPSPNFERTNVWYAGYGMGGHIVGNENTSPTIVSLSGCMVGIEGIYDAGSRKIGFFYDRSNVETDVQQLVSRGTVNTDFFGGYLASELEDGYRFITLGFGQDRYRSRRVLDVGTDTNRINEIARGGYQGWQSSLYTERGYDLQGDWSMLQPYLGLQYSHLRQNAFDETDATYAGLDMEATDYDSLRFYLGTRIDMPFIKIGYDRRNGQSLGGTVQFQTAWIHEMLDKTAPICNAQVGASTLSNNFIVSGADCGRDWWLGSVGTQWQLSRSFSFYGDYTLLLNGVQTLHTGSAGLSLSW